ncbi:MAG: hypothetical protein ABI609_06090 [Acidobacteriota bacterium]
MYVVALPYPPGGESTVEVLAGALRLSRLEAKARIQASASSPAVIARFADRTAAEACSRRLADDGLPNFVVARGDIESEAARLAVATFAFEPEGLSARGTSTGDVIPYASVRLLLRASRLISETTTEIVRERKLSLGRAILTGGLVMTRTEKRKRQLTRGEPESLLYVYSAGHRPLYFAQLTLDYRGLGGRLAPNAAENFVRLWDALRERCPHAIRNDLLTSRTFQAALLGPALSPETHLDLAITLLRRDLAA